jgi:hypothetical protein
VFNDKTWKKISYRFRLFSEIFNFFRPSVSELFNFRKDGDTGKCAPKFASITWQSLELPPPLSQSVTFRLTPFPLLRYIIYKRRLLNIADCAIVHSSAAAYTTKKLPNTNCMRYSLKKPSQAKTSPINFCDN